MLPAQRTRTAVGAPDGVVVGLAEGRLVGVLEGEELGAVVGCVEGATVGAVDGAPVVGAWVGALSWCSRDGRQLSLNTLDQAFAFAFALLVGGRAVPLPPRLLAPTYLVPVARA